MAANRYSFDECFESFPESAAPRDLIPRMEEAVQEMRKIPLEMEQKLIFKRSLGLTATYEVTFPGYGGLPLQGYLTLPRKLRRTPTLLIFPEYDATPDSYASVTDQGMATFLLLPRRYPGATDSSPQDSSGTPDLIGRFGMESLETGYLFHLFMGAIRSLDLLRHHKGVQNRKISLMGSGLGSAMALFTAALEGEQISALALKRPELAWLPRWLEESPSLEAAEIKQLLTGSPAWKQREILQQLSYLDMLHWAEKVRLPVYCSTLLEDERSFPVPAFAFFHHLLTDKTMDVYPGKNQDPRDQRQNRRALEFLQSWNGVRKNGST